MDSSELPVVNDLDATLNYHELIREELDVPCSVDHCRELAMKIERWEPLLPHIGLGECDRIAIEKDYSSYEEQRIALLSKWKRLFGSRATYLKLAEGLEKIGHFNLVDELCKIYKSKPAEHQDNDDESEKEIFIEKTVKEPTHLKQRRDWKEILDDENIISKTRIISSKLIFIALILCMFGHSSTLLVCGFVIPETHNYYIGGALLKKANGDVWKKVVIGGGLLGRLIGGVYWIFMGKNILGNHLGAVIGIYVSGTMFGTILGGVLLGMAINNIRGGIKALPLVGAACFYLVPEYTNTNYIKEVITRQSDIILIAVVAILFCCVFCTRLIFILCLEYELYKPFTLVITYALPYVYYISCDYGIWPPMAGAYWGTLLGGALAHLNYKRTF